MQAKRNRLLRAFGSTPQSLARILVPIGSHRRISGPVAEWAELSVRKIIVVKMPLSW